MFYQWFTMFYDVLQCFTSVSWCFTMFDNVLWSLASRATTDVDDRAAAEHLRDRDNAAGVGDNSAGIGDSSVEIGDDDAGIADIAAKVTPC